MTDNNGDANDKATGNGGDAGAGTGNERDKWSRSDWERFHQSESDRRVTEALKKKEEDYKTLLENTTATADEKLKAYETQLSEERTRAEFMSLANSKGVADPKAAWAVVKQSELTDGKGKIDFDELKTANFSDYLEFEAIKNSQTDLLSHIKKYYKNNYNQVQQQLLCSGLDSANIVFLAVYSYDDEENMHRDIKENEFIKVRIFRDEAVIAEIKGRAQIFQTIKDYYSLKIK
jgi:predicted DNA-binding ArsR family transcriptional regulator